MIADLLYHRTKSPLGLLTLAGTHDALLYLRFAEYDEPFEVPVSWQHNAKRFENEVAQLKAYFEGKIDKFDIAIDLRGSDYNVKVWHELLRIPFGEVITYGELARRIGTHEGAQAVGNANGKNPIPIIVPCHRVIAAENKIGGFTGGVDKKQFLLQLEEAKNVQFDLF